MHVEVKFNLQQTVLDELEHPEENQRGLPIWGTPYFENHQVNFHYEYTPSKTICDLIQHQMDLVDKDFTSMVYRWGLLESKVDRHLDIILQFRVLERQELAIYQRNIATKLQNIAVEEAKRSRVQARSTLVFTSLTIVFLPLTFSTSYFGTNLSDISGMDSRFFWIATGPISIGIIAIVFTLIRAMNTVKQPDEEQAIRSRDQIEVEPSWKSRLKLGRSKLKLG